MRPVRVRQQLPAEQRAELDEGGAVLCGGTALVGATDRFLSSALDIPVTTAPDPMSCTVLGLETILENIAALTLGGRRFQPAMRVG